MKGVCNTCKEIGEVVWKDAPAKALGANLVDKELVCKGGCKL